MRITVTGVGAAASLLVILVFSACWILKIRKRDGTVLSAGEIMNAAGFGLLPGLAVWKIFEQRTPLGTGAAGFDPLRDLPVLTRNGRFAVSGTEIFLAVLCFAAAVIWLIFRKEELPGNGDLLLTVVCV